MSGKRNILGKNNIVIRIK